MPPGVDERTAAWMRPDPDRMVMVQADALVARGAAVGRGMDVNRDGSLFLTAVGGTPPRTFLP